MSVTNTTKMSSYPPSFRPKHQLGTPVDHPADFPDTLPTINISDLDMAKLHHACSDSGIFRLVNHGIPELLIHRLQAIAKGVLDLDFETKQALIKGPINLVYNWGHAAITPPSVEWPKEVPETGMEVVSLKMGQRRMCGVGELLSTEEDGVMARIVDFRDVLEEYGEHMTRLARALFEAMKRNLHIHQNLLQGCDSNKLLDESSGLVRVNRYPPDSASEVDQEGKGLHAHTDSSVLTILLHDDVTGLEILRDGLWLPVKPVPNTLIVNLGDMLQVMSDDKYKSVEHRVVLNTHRERISVGYFVFPEEDMVIGGSEGKYRPFSYKEFMRQVHEDVAKIGWKVGLSRFLAN